MRTCFLKDREVGAWDEGEGAGLIEKRCCTGCLLGVYFVVFIDTKRILQKLNGCKQKLKEGIGAEGGTRTPTSCLTRPSNVRVCQFRHFGMK